MLLLLLAEATVLAGSATWDLNPTSSDWDTASNWTPGTVPYLPTDTATFDVSNITDIVDNGLFFTKTVDGIVFNAGANAFTISIHSNASFDLLFTISGFGITNNSGITQSFITVSSAGIGSGGVIQFTNSATAGDLTVFTNNGSYTATRFFDTSSAGSGTFTNNNDTAYSFSLAATEFFDASTAANATLIATGGTIQSLGGVISFQDDSIGATLRVEVFHKGSLDISLHNAPGVTVGSIEGIGTVTLGGNNLTVGSNDLCTTFSGLIRDSGSVTKIGQGRLTLSSRNTYTGGTIVVAGGLAVSNRTGSGTGTGPVQVNAGSLRGKGIIAGAVTVGTGSGLGAFLAPGQGASEPSTLTIQRALTCKSDSAYTCKLNAREARAEVPPI